jgi:hypothetical protein
MCACLSIYLSILNSEEKIGLVVVEWGGKKQTEKNVFVSLYYLCSTSWVFLACLAVNIPIQIFQLLLIILLPPKCFAGYGRFNNCSSIRMEQCMSQKVHYSILLFLWNCLIMVITHGCFACELYRNTRITSKRRQNWRYPVYRYLCHALISSCCYSHDPTSRSWVNLAAILYQ